METKLRAYHKVSRIFGAWWGDFLVLGLPSQEVVLTTPIMSQIRSMQEKKGRPDPLLQLTDLIQLKPCT